MKRIDLNESTKMPIVGMGTFPLNRIKLVKTVLVAYFLGVRSFDTSASYGNERWLGIALRMLKFIGKKDVFVTTKLSNSAQRDKTIKKEFHNSLKKLGLKKVNLYLMHWPHPDTYLDSWKEMEQIYESGLVDAIGVCNFNVHHLDELLKVAKIKPVINQIELHPLFNQKELQEYCKGKGIKIQSYSPLARMDTRLIKNDVLLKLSSKYKKTVPQIILRWNVQNGFITIPKSGNRKRIKENINIFDFSISQEDMNNINGLNIDLRVRHDPDTVDYSKV